jgi:hypothetical protein
MKTLGNISSFNFQDGKTPDRVSNKVLSFPEGCRERADSRGAGGGRMESWEFGKTGNEVRGR